MNDAPKNIDEVILLVQQNPPVLVKDKAGQVGNQKTKYANLEQVNAKVLPLLNQLGTTYVCLPNLQDDGKFVLEYELKHVPSGTVKGGRYPLKLSENPMQMGSAITYSRRYALLSALGIVAEDEDDDGRAANDSGSTAQRSSRPRGRQAAAAESGQTAQRRASVAAPPLPSDDRITREQRERLRTAFSDAGYTDKTEMLAYAQAKAGRDVESADALTQAEAEKVITALTAPPDDTQPPTGGAS